VPEEQEGREPTTRPTLGWGFWAPSLGKVLEIGLLTSPVVSSYRLPIVAYLSSFSRCSDLSWTDSDRQTGGRNWSGKRRHRALKDGQRAMNHE